jgi:pteridine reductase
MYLPATLQTATLELSRKFWAIHVDALMLLTQRLEPMLRASRGHVITMVDVLAERPWPAYLPYSVSKAGLANLTLGLARALAPEVTVNGIAPGIIAWPANFPEAEQEKLLKRIPLARAGTPEDAAKLVKFLCTEGNYITGQVIRLDGGRWLV